MGENSKIEWCHHTFNIAWGCAKVSPACTNCYAEAWSKRMGFDVWGVEADRRTMGAAYWRQPLKWNRDAERAGERRRVFCSSMADWAEAHPVLHHGRKKLFDLIEQTPWLDWLLLTKRHDNLAEALPARWGDGFPNVWLGVTAENQEWAERRIPALLNTPAAVRFISAEPLLGPLDLRRLRPDGINFTLDALTGQGKHLLGFTGKAAKLDWVITGGESGPGARPMHPDWARSLRDQCQREGVAFHFKQWGEWIPESHRALRPGLHWAGGHHILPTDEIKPGELFMYRVGKKEAGRLLDGRTWDELPATT